MAELIDESGQRWQGGGNITGHFGEFAPAGTISYEQEQTRRLLVLVALVALVLIGGGRR